MLKFRRNRAKPEVIRILFVTPLDPVESTKELRSPIATEKHADNKSRLFGKKNPELLSESWKLNGNIFFELFLVDLDKKMTSKGYKRERNKKQSETV